MYKVHPIIEGSEMSNCSILIHKKCKGQWRIVFTFVKLSPFASQVRDCISQ